eukprot:sb/3478723/
MDNGYQDLILMLYYKNINGDRLLDLPPSHELLAPTPRWNFHSESITLNGWIVRSTRSHFPGNPWPDFGPIFYPQSSDSQERGKKFAKAGVPVQLVKWI